MRKRDFQILKGRITNDDFQAPNLNTDRGTWDSRERQAGGRKMIHLSLNKHLLKVCFVPSTGLALGTQWWTRSDISPALIEFTVGKMEGIKE